MRIHADFAANWQKCSPEKIPTVKLFLSLPLYAGKLPPRTFSRRGNKVRLMVSVWVGMGLGLWLRLGHANTNHKPNLYDTSPAEKKYKHFRQFAARIHSNLCGVRQTFARVHRKKVFRANTSSADSVERLADLARKLFWQKAHPSALNRVHTSMRFRGGRLSAEHIANTWVRFVLRAFRYHNRGQLIVKI